MSTQEDCPAQNLQDILASLPPVSATNLAQGDSRPAQNLPVLVVLDDDPTGTQTCHDVNVLTVWDHATLVEELETGCNGFFILTNSRALPTPQARDLIRSICEAVKQAAAVTGRSFEVVLRGDSTLRGHFPDEPEVAEEVVGTVDAWILAPFFRQGGRYTIDDVHYVANPDGSLIPAAQTPFAADATFGYQNSNLRRYVQEKSNGSIAADRIDSVSLEEIRVGGSHAVARHLLGLPPRSIVIVNAIADEDMEVFVQGLLQAQTQGKKYLYRTGAAFVSTRLGIAQIPPLSAQDLHMDLSGSAHGGLIIAGSYVPKTTSQLKSLIDGRSEQDLVTITLDVEVLLANTEAAEHEVLKAAQTAGDHIDDGRDVLIMTSRKLIVGSDEVSSLKIGSAVAASLVQFLQALKPRPRYIIAKGGITSSDAATKGLKMRRAKIMGQAASGVPLWVCTESTSKFAGIPYVVFPGNVGNDSTLLDLVKSWTKQTSQPAINQPLMDGRQHPPMQYQRLGKAGIKTSKIILGCMTFGNPRWEGSPWTLSEEQALPLLKKAYDLGINTWDTADTYSNGESERIVGTALRKYKIPRSRVVILTKVFYPVMDDNSRPQPAVNSGLLVNQMGLSRKHIFEAVDASLQRLGTDYIDVLQLHRLDHDTSPEEIMCALHDLVKMGKVLYLGGSSMHCWEFARLQYTARMNRWTTFSSMQGFYNLLYREEEREMNPFCRAEGIGLIPWSPLARGRLAKPLNTVTARSEQDSKAKAWFQGGEQDAEIIRRVEMVAREKGVSMASVATAWCFHKDACPIVGLNSLERMEKVTEALTVELSNEDLTYLEETYAPLQVQAM